MFSNKAKFIGSAGSSVLVSCLVSSSFSFAHEGGLRPNTYMYAGNEDYELLGVNNVDELIDKFVNENNNLQSNNGDEYREGDSEENLNKINEEEAENTHTKGRDVLQNSIYLEKDGLEDPSKELKFIYLENEDENVCAESNQSANKKETYPDAVKYEAIYSGNYFNKRKNDNSCVERSCSPSKASGYGALKKITVLSLELLPAAAVAKATAETQPLLRKNGETLFKKHVKKHFTIKSLLLP